MFCKECGKYNPDTKVKCAYCGGALKEVIPVEKVAGVKNDKEDVVKENENRFFNEYTRLPLILTSLLALLFFIISIYNPTVIQFEVSYEDYIYGSMASETFFGAMMTWWLIGTVVCTLTYFFSRILLSYNILRISYLKEIKDNIKDKE